jgi:hypothetical protein
MAITRWTETRQPTGLQLVITILVCLGGTAMMVFALVKIYLEDFGEPILRKYEIFGVYIVGLLLGLYACTGLYQMLFIERRTKFVVRQVEFGVQQFAVRGYFGKTDYFMRSDVVSVEPYDFKVNRKSIMTLMDWRIGSYQITLKDSRAFYVSKAIDKSVDLMDSISRGLVVSETIDRK